MYESTTKLTILALLWLHSAQAEVVIAEFGSDSGKLNFTNRSEYNYGFTNRAELQDSFQADITNYAQCNWFINAVDLSAHQYQDFRLSGSLTTTTPESTPLRIWLYDSAGRVAMHPVEAPFSGIYTISHSDWSYEATDAFGHSGNGIFDWRAVVKVGFRAQFPQGSGHSVTFTIDTLRLPARPAMSFAPSTELPVQVLSLEPISTVSIDSLGNANTDAFLLFIRSEETEHEAFLRYDLSEIAASGTIERAEIVLWPTLSDGQNPNFTLEQIEDSSDGWEPTNMTWSTKPNSRPFSQISLDAPMIKDVPQIIDITALVADTWANDPAKELGLRVYASGAMPTQAAQFAGGRHNSLKRRPYLHITRRSSTQSPLTLMHTGDSLARGGVGALWSTSYQQAGWRYYLHYILSAQQLDFRAVGPRTSDGSIAAAQVSQFDRPMAYTANAGYSGETISYIRDHIAEWMTTHSPEVVTLIVGTNNLAAHTTPAPYPLTQPEVDDTATKYTELLNNLFDVSASAKVIMAKIPPVGGAYAGNNAVRVEAFNDQVIVPVYNQFAASHPGRIFLVDCYSPLTQDDLRNDNVHPNSQGHKKLARVWHTGLMEALGRSTEFRYASEGDGAAAALRGGIHADTAFGEASLPLSPAWRNALARIKADSNPDKRAKSLLKFDLIDLPVKIGTATLGFVYYGKNSSGGYEVFEDQTLELHGIADGSDHWTAPSVTWNNAPGNDLSSNRPDSQSTTYLDSVSIPAGSRTGDLFTFSSPALADFLTWASGGDQLASFIIVASGSDNPPAYLVGTSDADQQPPFLIVTPNLADNFNDWARYYFPELADRQASADPDFDALDNLLEYALGSQPDAATSGIERAPQFGIIQTTGEYLSLRFTPQRDDLTYTVWASDRIDASPWTESTVLAPIIPGTPFTHVDGVEVNSLPSLRFLRLEVSTP